MVVVGSDQRLLPILEGVRERFARRSGLKTSSLNAIEFLLFFSVLSFVPLAERPACPLVAPSSAKTPEMLLNIDRLPRVLNFLVVPELSLGLSVVVSGEQILGKTTKEEDKQKLRKQGLKLNVISGKTFDMTKERTKIRSIIRSQDTSWSRT